MVAWAYQADQGAKAGQLSKQTLYTPKLDVRLASKARTGKGAASGIGGNVIATSLLASDGVIVELEGFAGQMIFAKAKTLSADMTNGRDSALVKLDGEQLADGTVADAEVSQGERGANKITGLQMLLDQKSRSIHIPRKGTFNFVQAGAEAGGCGDTGGGHVVEVDGLQREDVIGAFPRGHRCASGREHGQDQQADVQQSAGCSAGDG